MLTKIIGVYDLNLLIISVVIAILAAYTALDLAGQIHASQGKLKMAWLISGAIAMGTGIWSMHFVGMLAFRLPIQVHYDVRIVLISIVAAILASGCALFAVSQQTMNLLNWLGGSLLMGLGITTMHYTGMAAIRLPASIHYNYPLVALSVVIAFTVSLIALRLSFDLQGDTIIAKRWQKIVSAVIMGAAIPTMHYTGMAATSFYPMSIKHLVAVSTLNSSVLSITITTGTVSILGIALLISLETKVHEQMTTLVKLKHEIIERQQIENRLQEQTQQLEQTLEELKQTQAQLIQSEKMSSLGQMVAGIAHEMNNPITFIHGNLKPAIEYSKNIVELLKLYQMQYPNPAPIICEEIENLDLDFMIEDLKNIFQSMQVGCDRINNIVLSLRNFSRLDESELKVVNIHEGIDSTLMIISHRLRAIPQRPQITVSKEYGDLPYINCYPGLLNQVFLNILTNAIDAFEDTRTCPEEEDDAIYIQVEPLLATKKNLQDLGQITSNVFYPIHNPEIRIRTQVLDKNWIAIYIADNGPGMSEEVRSKLFDPFFTTKPVGKGTGLGLFISYQIIVNKHGGKIECNPVPGKGTEFIIMIPIRELLAF